MDLSVNEVVQLIADLSLTDDNNIILKKIQQRFEMLSLSSVISEMTEERMMRGFFDAYSHSSASEEHVSNACRFLATLLGELDTPTLYRRLAPLLQSTFTYHPNIKVKGLCLKQLVRLRSLPEGYTPIVDDPQCLCELLQFHSTSPEDFEKAEGILLPLCDSLDNTDEVFNTHTALGDKIHELLDSSRTEGWFRTMKIIIAWSSRKDSYLQACHHHGYLSSFLSMLVNGGDDVLGQLCVLEEVEVLALSPHGARYLVDQGVCHQLYTALQQPPRTLEDTLLRPGIMKFFGRLYRQGQSHWDFDPLFQTVLNSVAVGTDDVSVETLGVLGDADDGKLTLCAMDALVKPAVQALGSIIKTPGPEERREKCVRAFTQLMSIKKLTNELQELTFKWFEWLMDEPIKVFLSLLTKHPSASLRIAVLSLLKELSSLGWAQQIIGQHEGLQKHLLTRPERREHEEQAAHFSVVATLVTSPTIRAHLDPRLQLALRKYWKEGPFYKHPGEAQVDYEQE